MSKQIKLHLKSPLVSAFLQDWQEKYQRKFDFSKDEDQMAFREGMTEIANHIAHAAHAATLSTVLDADGVNTMFIAVVPRKS